MMGAGGVSGWLKLPGLFYRAELDGHTAGDLRDEFAIESAGSDGDGRPLVAVYCRVHAEAAPARERRFELWSQQESQPCEVEITQHVRCARRALEMSKNTARNAMS
jgi:hypothetical protein